MSRSASRAEKPAAIIGSSSAPTNDSRARPGPAEYGGEARWLVWAIAAALAIVTLALFWRTGDFEFVNYDDPNYLTLVPEVRNGLSPQTVRWAFTSSHHCNWHPLTTLTYLAESSVFGVDNPGLFHLTNVVLHAAGTVVLFLVLRAMTAAAVTTTAAAGATTWPSALVAALFALHPLHVESVAWVSERKDVLSALFMFLAIAAYTAYARRGGWRWYLATVALLILGLMSKPMLVTLPFVFLLLDFWPLERRQRWTRLVLEKVPMIAIALVSSVVTFVIQRDCGAMSTIEKSPLGPRLANAAMAYVQYVVKAVWPTNLTVFYPYSDDLTKPPLSYWPLGLIALLAATAAVVWFGRGGRRYLPVGWFWFLGMLAPVIGVVQVGQQAMAERYTYLPLIGLFIMVVWGARDAALRGGPGRRRGIAVTAAVVLLACTVASARQLGYWRNSHLLFERGLEVAPDNPVFRFHVAEAYRQQGQAEEAIEHYRRVLEFDPNNADAMGNLGLSLAMTGRNAEGMEMVEKSLQILEAHAKHTNSLAARQRHAAGYHNVALLKLQAGDLTAAERALRRVLEIDPSNPESHTTLAVVLMQTGRLDEVEPRLTDALKLAPRHGATYKQLGHLRLKQNRPAEAIEAYRQAVKLRPADTEADFHLGLALSQGGQAAAARQHFVEFGARYPGDARPYFQIGVMAQTAGDAAGAVAAYQEALRRDPASAARNNLAWLRATAMRAADRDATEAVRLAESLRDEPGGRRPEVLDTLAATYAEAGDFKRAVETATAAVDLADRAGDLKLADAIRHRLGLYERKQPYRE
ncbi:MAG: protein O-mannosyl-transferase [Phycisphaerales bacterium]|jgi:tetratricopeptide (TPR) repeat protein|nr:protein O-mannosyl-transferase [Phycisphaerales bacterium]